MNDSELLFYLYIFISILMCLIALPMLLRKVPPNNWYGFRTPATLRKPELWYATNATAGRGLLISGIVSLISTLFVGSTINIDDDTFAILITVIFMAGIGITLIYTWRKHLA